MKLTITVNKLGIVKWWIDASYLIHEDCKGQTGVMMLLGEGALFAASWKQKLNVRSSTEGELVGLDDALPIILWCKYFIEAQGYTVEHNIVHQDNKSHFSLLEMENYLAAREHDISRLGTSISLIRWRVAMSSWHMSQPRQCGLTF